MDRTEVAPKHLGKARGSLQRLLDRLGVGRVLVDADRGHLVLPEWLCEVQEAGVQMEIADADAAPIRARGGQSPPPPPESVAWHLVQ